MTGSIPSDGQVARALAEKDSAALRGFVEEGISPDWKDARGNTLLHYAAGWGDDSFVVFLLDKKATASTCNFSGDTPRDRARIWGHDALAKKLHAEILTEKAARPLPFASLDEIRRHTTEGGVNPFYLLVKQGRFDEIVALAAKENRGFLLEDLMARGPRGDSVLLAVCIEDEFEKLVQPGLWAGRPDDFLAVWNEAPEIARRDMDRDSFLSRIYRQSLQKNGKTGLKGPG